MEDFNYNSVKANLKAMRVKAGMTQKDVANALGVTIQTMRSYENMPNKLTIGKIVALAKIYKVQPRIFFMD